MFVLPCYWLCGSVARQKGIGDRGLGIELLCVGVCCEKSKQEWGKERRGEEGERAAEQTHNCKRRCQKGQAVMKCMQGVDALIGE